MRTMYATITSKGQITLPAAVRRALNLQSGQKLAVTVQNDSVVLNAPRSVQSVRTRLKDEAKKSGTWGHVPVAGEGWASRAEDHRAND
mgnify:CR=1 FL=1